MTEISLVIIVRQSTRTTPMGQGGDPNLGAAAWAITPINSACNAFERAERIDGCRGNGGLLDQLSDGEIRALVHEFGPMRDASSQVGRRRRLRNADALPRAVELLRGCSDAHRSDNNGAAGLRNDSHSIRRPRTAGAHPCASSIITACLLYCISPIDLIPDP
ncbi:MAG: DUF1232 domain-containing protein [Phycisphaerales bacterium]|nr:DUF1232 domain-containing protein [Phycisphaerales bacterium]